MTPIERAARALGEVYDGYADPTETPENWARAQDGVRAVLTAISEPSEAMVVAGWASECIIPSQSPEGAWQAMIDAMLEEG